MPDFTLSLQSSLLPSDIFPDRISGDAVVALYPVSVAVLKGFGQQHRVGEFHLDRDDLVTGGARDDEINLVTIGITPEVQLLRGAMVVKVGLQEVVDQILEKTAQ